MKYTFVIIVFLFLSIPKLGLSQQSKEYTPEELEQAAKDGDPEAQEILGLIYNKTENYIKAAYYFQKAAEKGKVESQTMLGTLLVMGSGGLEQDVDTGIYWLYKGARNGNDRAQLYIGMMYFEGAYAPKDRKEAKKWVDKSRKQGNEEASKFYRENEMWKY